MNETDLKIKAENRAKANLLKSRAKQLSNLKTQYEKDFFLNQFVGDYAVRIFILSQLPI